MWEGADNRLHVGRNPHVEDERIHVGRYRKGSNPLGAPRIRKEQLANAFPP